MRICGIFRPVGLIGLWWRVREKLCILEFSSQDFFSLGVIFLTIPFILSWLCEIDSDEGIGRFCSGGGVVWLEVSIIYVGVGVSNHLFFECVGLGYRMWGETLSLMGYLSDDLVQGWVIVDVLSKGVKS